MLTKEEKHKAIAIPVSFFDGEPRFLTVKDRRFKEWIFVSGGCRKREIQNPLRCALRELEEETRGVVNIKQGTYSEFTVVTKNHTQEEIDKNTKEGVEITLIYHIYILDYNISKYRQQELIERFNYEKMKTDERKRNRLPIKRTYDENDQMSFDTLGEFYKKKRWNFISEQVVENPDFMVALNTLNRKNFNIK